MQVRSSAEDWLWRGNELMEVGQHAPAAKSFEFAGCVVSQAHALGRHSLQSAADATHPERARVALLEVHQT